MGAIGGFRPGTLMNFRYSQVSLALVRDPENQTRTRLTVTPTICQNKRKEKKIHRTQDQL